MSPAPVDNGDPQAVMAAGQREYVGARADSDTVAGAAPPPRAVRLPEEFDHRLRGLHLETTGPIPTTSARTVGSQHRRRRLLAIAAFLAVAALAVLLLQAFVIQPFAVPGNAMAPTLQSGDRILVLKWGLLEDPIRSGAIVVFHPPRSLPCTVAGGRRGDLVLRVVALPGETIRSIGDTILVNGRPLSERGWYDPRYGQVGSTPIANTRLAADRYFVMADNRADACDSRVFGAISKSSVVGQGIAIVSRRGHVVLGAL